MTTPNAADLSVYQHPRYYALGYRWDTAGECNFIEACLARYGKTLGKKDPKKKSKPASVRLLDIGCGSGRHLIEMAKRGHDATGFDVQQEMVAFAKEQARKAKVPAHISKGDLRAMALTGQFDLAICMMDTFRFLLTNAEITGHLRTLGEHMSPGGLYITDFWVPMRWDQMANEIYQWEQTEDETTVRVFYLQHPESVDPVNQTFEDELVFAIEENGESKEIRGARTRTRLLMPQEYRALVEASGAFEVLGMFGDFDLEKPLEPKSDTWRMVSVLRKKD